MIVEKGVPKKTSWDDGDASNNDVITSLAGVGKTAGKRRAGLPNDEVSSDEDDDEDDIAG